MRFLLIFILIVNCASVGAQFTYFNQITGVLGDENSEVMANVEVISNGYVVWGAGIDSIGQLFHFTRKHDFEGDILVEKVLIFPNQYTYSGVTNSFKWNPYNQHFVYIQGYVLPNGQVEAFLIEFDENLDTTFTKRYSIYPPFTYAIAFEVENDGYIVLGEIGNDAENGAGTFIMKLNFDGAILWSEIMQPNVPSFIYRNWSVTKTLSGYLISGGLHEGGGMDAIDSGIITITDFTGNTLSEIQILYEDELVTNNGDAVNTTNGEIWFCRSIGYADVAEVDNPAILWNKIRLEKFDLETEEIYWMQDYHADFEFIMGGTRKMIATPDGGAAILGLRFGFNFDIYSWMMKLDADGNEEWFQEYTYHNCETCANILQDIEIAPDGGYIAAGYIADYSIDIRNATWLLKVDACGDVEWQGCAPVGVREKEPKAFSVYPNPSAGRFKVASDFNHVIASWTVFTLSGQKLAEGKTVNNENLEINLNLPVGLYALELVQKDGRRENHKIQILR